MKSYKDPSFQDRVGRAAEAKQKALDQLRAKPPVDEAVLAERAAARQAKEAADAEKRAAKKAVEQQAKADKAAEAERQREAESAAKPSEAELKAARDARYAARKNRK
jgi:hypothetical protein